MTRLELELATKFVREAAARYVNDGCNDWPWPKAWTHKERLAFYLAYEAGRFTRDIEYRRVARKRRRKTHEAR